MERERERTCDQSVLCGATVNNNYYKVINTLTKKCKCQENGKKES